MNTLHTKFLKQQQIEMKYWREVLRRIVSVIKSLASRGLAFRGSDQTLDSSNNWNFVGILEIISEHDPLLASHISNHGDKGKDIFLIYYFPNKIISYYIPMNIHNKADNSILRLFLEIKV